MAKKKRQVAKRPPAHEVIIARLQELARELEEERRKRPRGYTLISTAEVGWRYACGELLDVLECMHLPEQERPKILAALRKLKPELIGVHRSHVRLLKRLSGHSPAHAMGTESKRRHA